ncbi:MAG: imelysin family protein [Phototrophicaceae bacterium]
MKLFKSLALIAIVLSLSISVFAQDDVETLQSDAVSTYADIVYASYADSLETATDLNDALIAFVAEPSEETLTGAQNAWLVARDVYGQTEAYRFYGGPIDDEDGPEGQINAWPMDESYVDYVEGAPDAGIINNVDDFPEITIDLLLSLNEEGGEENVATGYHAIEFLLWGQDLSADSAGERPYTDYTSADNADRRGEYLLLVGQLLVDDLQTLVDAWSPEVEDNYRSDFLALPTEDALSNILTGIGVLAKSELAGERIFTAYDNQDQEDEHSCFSDNTHADIIANAQGVINVYTGTYTSIDGTEISGVAIADIVESLDSDLNAELLALLDSVNVATHAIPVPFDQAIILPDGRDLVFETVTALLDTGDKLVEVADAIGLTIDTALPE